MTLAQRIIVLLGLTGILHSSMVPPVQQGSELICRYHEFVERGWPFTRGYGVTAGDLVALISEYGIIISITAAAYLIAGAIQKNREPS